MLRTLLTVLLLLVVTSAASAQSIDYERSRYSPAAYYKYEQEGDVTILVSVWGAVKNPGLYEVPQSTQLNKIVSLAGGPSSGTHRFGTDEEMTIRLLREDPSGRREVVFERHLEDDLFVPEENIALRPGDIITFERSITEKFIWRDAFTIVSGVATLGLVLERFGLF